MEEEEEEKELAINEIYARNLRPVTLKTYRTIDRQRRGDRANSSFRSLSPVVPSTIHILPRLRRRRRRIKIHGKKERKKER